ncbi:MAG: hypothetical protein IT285_04570 [Bdellovibrionales bacterium]|nr:hypothetical protein [Bdellovibrionales bacterium]
MSKAERTNLMNGHTDGLCQSATEFPSVVGTAEGIAEGCGGLNSRGNLKVFCADQSRASDDVAPLTLDGTPRWLESRNTANFGARGRAADDQVGSNSSRSVDLTNADLVAISDGTKPADIVARWQAEVEAAGLRGADGSRPDENKKAGDAAAAEGAQGLLSEGETKLRMAGREENTNKASNDALGYASASTTKGLNTAATVTAQMSDGVGSQVVAASGQMAAMEANQPGKTQADVYRAAAAQASAAAIQQGVVAGVHAIGAIAMGARLGQHSSDEKDATTDAKNMKALISSKTGDDVDRGELARLAGRTGNGNEGDIGAEGQGQVFYRTYDGNRKTLAERMNDKGINLNDGYALSHMRAADGEECTDENQLAISERKIMRNLNQFGFVQNNGRWVDEKGLEGTAEHPRVRAATQRNCREQIYSNRIASFKDKGGKMKQDVDRIAGGVIQEQQKGASEAGQGLFTQLMGMATRAGAAVAQGIMAAKYNELADKFQSPDTDAPAIDTEFDPLAFNEGTGDRGGPGVTGFGGGDNFAAEQDDDEQKEEEVADLGEGFGNGNTEDDLTETGPEASNLTPGADNGGGGGGAPGLGGGGTGPSGDDKGDSDAATYAGLNERGAGYGSGATFGGGGGRRGKGGGNSGIDLNSLLGQLLPGQKGEEDKNGILDYGGRAPAGVGESLLDRSVNIFERIHTAYQDRGRKGIVGAP